MFFMFRLADDAYSGFKWSVCMSQHHIALFASTLGSAESISPVALRALWVNAGGSGSGSVSGIARSTQGVGNLHDVELRLRHVLGHARLHATLTGLH